MFKLAVIAVSAASLAPAGAQAAATCTGLIQPATAVSKRADAALVSTIGGQKTSPATVGQVLAQGAWRVVFATPSEAERGVFFFRRDGGGKQLKLVDVWGGVIAPGERAETIRWISDHYRSPARLTTCMVDLVIEGQ